MKLTSLVVCIPLTAAIVTAAVVYGPPTVPPDDSYVHAIQHFTVLPKNRPMSLKLIELQYQSYLLQAPTDAEYADLKDEAFICWSDADPTYRNFWKVKLENQTVLIVGDFISDRGDYCFYYFNSAGEYLNSYCGGADRRWAWND